MKTLRAIAVLFCLLLPACLEKAGPAAGLGGSSFAGPAEPNGAASIQDTPPIAGPSEDQDAKPEVPVGECKEENGVNCPEKLVLSREHLCARTNTALNPLLTLSQATVSSPKPLASNGQATLRLWRYQEGTGGSPTGTFAAPTSDIEVTEVDLDPAKKDSQLAAAPDGTVTFHLVAGQKTGYYEFWVTGDLDTAYGNLTVEMCTDSPEVAAPGPQNPPPPAPSFQAK